MKHFFLIPSCALLALGVLTSCQKEEKTATQLANDLTTELQNITDYRTAEAAAPRVAAMNKRFQNASVRVFSVGNNALVGSTPDGYADALGALVKEIGRVRASKPVNSADGDVDESRLIATVGVGAGVAPSASNKERTDKGQTYLRNGDAKDNNVPPPFEPCYGSKALEEALSYTADVADFPATRFDSPDDVPAIPAPVEPAAEEEEPADSAAAATEETGSAESSTADEAGDGTAATDEATADTDSAAATDDAADDSASTDTDSAATDGEEEDTTSSDEGDDSAIDIEL